MGGPSPNLHAPSRALQPPTHEASPKELPGLPRPGGQKKRQLPPQSSASTAEPSTLRPLGLFTLPWPPTLLVDSHLSKIQLDRLLPWEASFSIDTGGAGHPPPPHRATT